MLDEFRPLKLSDAARYLGLDPFEVVRLSVVFREASPDLRFPKASLERLREQAGLVDVWADRALPVDDNPSRAAVRGALAYLRDSGLIGSASTRLDNLARGLGAAEQEVIQEGAAILHEAGVLLLTPAPRGLQVSVAPGAEQLVSSIADGGEAPEELAALWMG